MKRNSIQKKNIINFNNFYIDESLFENHINKQKTKKLPLVNDLNELNVKSADEFLKALENMMQTKNFFKYCSSLLININPGPYYVLDYLNLKDWVSSTNESLHLNHFDKEKTELKPHLYSFIKYVFDTMILEKKDQVINILGDIGSGKTFNLIHIIEYYSTLYSCFNSHIENFELIHKSIQLIHIFGSIFRENNYESSSIGLILKLGFNNKNNLASFNIEAQILDFSLPLSNGERTLSIFHALIKGATDSLKRLCKLPVNNYNLSILKKSDKHFNEKTKEEFNFNDLELWNNFCLLLKNFKFSSDEIIEIINSLAFILNINDLIIKKNQGGKLRNIYYEFQRGITTSKLCKNLYIEDIKEFENIMGKFKTLQEAQIFKNILMKQTYHILFEFMLKKINIFLNEYFSKFGNKEIQNIIYLIDFPGQVEDKNLGGFTINIANECLNMYSASAYNEIIEKILGENLNLKRFKPLKSYSILSNCFFEGGFLDFFSRPLTIENFNKLKKNILNNQNLYDCFNFFENKKDNDNNFDILVSFTQKSIKYNYEDLYNDAKGILFNQKIFNIFNLSKNKVINPIYKTVMNKNITNFDEYFSTALKKLFEPIKNIKPFVVYCISFPENENENVLFKPNGVEKPIKRNSLKNNTKIEKSIKEKEYDFIKNSIVWPILNWDLYGYKEWMKIDDFIKEYNIEFNRMQKYIIKLNNKNNYFEDQNFKYNELSNKDKTKCILNILINDSDYSIGNNIILFKKGALKKMTRQLNSMIDTVEELSKENAKNIYTTKTSFNNVNNSQKKIKEARRHNSVRYSKLYRNNDEFLINSEQIKPKKEKETIM